MLVVNLWGAPSAGKSTVAAGLFETMKLNKRKVELVQEYAKELLLEKRWADLADQNKVFAEQNRRQRILSDTMDFAITDSPLPLSIIYQPHNYYRSFPALVMEHFDGYDNLNYFLHRVTDYEKIGRRETEQQSLEKEIEIKTLMEKNNIHFTQFDATPETANLIFEDILGRLPKPVFLHRELERANPENPEKGS